VLRIRADRPDHWDDNKEAYEQREKTFKAALAVAHAGGGPKAIESHEKKKKMVIEDRVKELIDSDTSFLELSPLAGFMMEYGNVPRAGMLTGNHATTVHG
jgi:3-methylcrotonyl-CoA carboxylase beta subunit